MIRFAVLGTPRLYYAENLKSRIFRMATNTDSKKESHGTKDWNGLF